MRCKLLQARVGLCAIVHAYLSLPYIYPKYLKRYFKRNILPEFRATVAGLLNISIKGLVFALAEGAGGTFGKYLERVTSSSFPSCEKSLYYFNINTAMELQILRAVLYYML